MPTANQLVNIEIRDGKRTGKHSGGDVPVAEPTKKGEQLS
jgi:hypothetical protein